MSSPEVEAAGEDAAEECCEEREPVPSPLQGDNDPLVTELYSINDQLVTYAFRLLEQSMTLSDAVVEVNQKIHTLPLRKAAAPDGGSSLEDDVEREAWKQLVSTWRSRVSCVGAEIVHITADIRLSPILEKLRGASPVDPDDGEPSPRADPAQNSCKTAQRGRADQSSKSAAAAAKSGVDSVAARRVKSVVVPSQRPVTNQRHHQHHQQQQLQQRPAASTGRTLAPVKAAPKKSTSLTQHDFAGKKVTSTLTAGINAHSAHNAGAAPAAPDGPSTAAHRSTASPTVDEKLVEMLASYRQQMEASDAANELKLPTIGLLRPGAAEAATRAAAAADRQWPSLPEVTSSSSASSSASLQKRASKNGNKIDVATLPFGPPPPRSCTAFPGSAGSVSRDHRKY